MQRCLRHRFQEVKAAEPLTAAERQAARADASLPPLPRQRHPVPEDLAEIVENLIQHDTPYRIATADLRTTNAYEVVVDAGRVILLLNTRHPWYRDLYGPLALSESGKDHDTARQIALTVLAAARAEATLHRRVERGHAQQFRRTWADVLATFMNA